MNLQTVLFVTMLFGPELQDTGVVEATPAQVLDLRRFSFTALEPCIGPGDILEVRIAAGRDQDRATQFPVRVGDDGAASLPDIGQLSVAGLELAEAEYVITAACIHKGLYRQPHVTVTMKHQGRNHVTVIGAVKSPGIYQLPRSATCWDALVAADGLTEDAGPNIGIRQSAQCRDGLVSWDVTAPDDRRALVSTPLQHGSVVVVERRDIQPVEVIGLVKKPGQYEYPTKGRLSLADAIALAGGVSSPKAEKVLIVHHTGEGEKKVVTTVSLKATEKNIGEEVYLSPGDVVSVEPPRPNSPRPPGPTTWGRNVPLF
jgi:polysaccharide export outer membrane protein